MTATALRAEPVRRLSRTLRRQQLLDCALAVFARDGIGRAGHTQIAELAGVSVATVFKYFPTRDALLDAVLRQVERRLLKLARACHSDPHSARAAFRAHARGWIRIAREEPDVVKIWLEWSASIRDEVWPRYLKLEDRLNRILAKTLERDPRVPANIKAIDAARAVHSVAHMVTHMIFAPAATAEDTESFSLNVVDVLLGFPAGTA